MMASTSCVTDPVSSHSEVLISENIRNRVTPTIDLLQYPKNRSQQVGESRREMRGTCQGSSPVPSPE
jgi:hypothetical protein